MSSKQGLLDIRYIPQQSTQTKRIPTSIASNRFSYHSLPIETQKEMLPILYQEASLLLFITFDSKGQKLIYCILPFGHVYFISIFISELVLQKAQSLIG